jgi:hypothetical protein
MSVQRRFEEEEKRSADPSRGEPGESTLDPRAANVLSAQATYGNAWVARRMLSRDPNPDLAVETEAKVKHKTGADVDAYLKASPFFKALVEAKFKGGTKAEGHVHIDTPAQFLTAWTAYAKARTNPDTGSTFTDAEARAWEPTVNAFRDGTEIHVHQDRGEPATTIHESIHLFSDDTFKATFGFSGNEGATELWTKKVCAEQKLTRGDFYPNEHKSVKKLADKVGEDALAAAYFQGKVTELEAAVDAKTSAGTAAKWKAAIKTGKYADADALL